MACIPLLQRCLPFVAAAFFCASIVAQPSPAVTFSGGPGTVPEGAASATYDAYDADGIFGGMGDHLIAGGSMTFPTGDGGWETGTLPLTCEGTPPKVAGGNGTSNEVEAEIYIVVTFKNAQGQVVGTHTTSQKTTACPTPG